MTEKTMTIGEFRISIPGATDDELKQYQRSYSKNADLFEALLDQIRSGSQEERRAIAGILNGIVKIIQL